mmetsp:Transcript_37793/g.119020  ORF Transcript_37793/g.119020 Transcript_37793/m.119020 type:complete len:338 (-) Transcript_37793:549-1562(-)
MPLQRPRPRRRHLEQRLSPRRAAAKGRRRRLHPWQRGAWAPLDCRRRRRRRGAARAARARRGAVPPEGGDCARQGVWASVSGAGRAGGRRDRGGRGGEQPLRRPWDRPAGRVRRRRTGRRDAARGCAGEAARPRPARHRGARQHFPHRQGLLVRPAADAPRLPHPDAQGPGRRDAPHCPGARRLALPRLVPRGRAQGGPHRRGRRRGDAGERVGARVAAAGGGRRGGRRAAAGCVEAFRVDAVGGDGALEGRRPRAAPAGGVAPRLLAHLQGSAVLELPRLAHPRRGPPVVCTRAGQQRRVARAAAQGHLRRGGSVRRRRAEPRDDREALAGEDRSG